MLMQVSGRWSQITRNPLKLQKYEQHRWVVQIYPSPFAHHGDIACRTTREDESLSNTQTPRVRVSPQWGFSVMRPFEKWQTHHVVSISSKLIKRVPCRKDPGNWKKMYYGLQRQSAHPCPSRRSIGAKRMHLPWSGLLVWKSNQMPQQLAETWILPVKFYSM